jgi:5,10-methylenetetrahydromethanopterin reductase
MARVIRRRGHRFGISLEPSWPVWESVGLAGRAEELGFSCVWVPDSGPAPPYSDPIVTLSAIAARTTKIRLGTAILNFYTRNPASIASSFLALSDLASRKERADQRAILGIGVGSPQNLSKFGIGGREGVIEELGEAIESIRELFQGKEVNVRTDSFTIDHVILSKAENKIPIYVGSNSPRGLRLAGGKADGVILTDRIPSDIGESLKRIDLGIGDELRDRSDLEIVDSVVISLDEDRERARRAAKATCAYLVAWMSEESAAHHGIDIARKKRITDFIDGGDEVSASRLVDRRMLDLLTASGDLDDCLSKCREYLSYDLDQIAFCEPFGPNRRKSIEAIGRRLIVKL